MPSVTKLLRLATMPETRHVIVAASRSVALRDLARRARSDRSGLLRDLARPSTTVGLVRDVIGHPATRELANVGYILLPSRYLPAGWAAMWLSRRVLGRFGDGRPTSKADTSEAQRRGAPRNATLRPCAEPPSRQREAWGGRESGSAPVEDPEGEA